MEHTTTVADVTTDAPHVPPSALDAVPAWLSGADEEEQRELSALGVVAAPTVDDAAVVDAQVSHLLRIIHDEELDIGRYTTAEKAEHEAIARRYDILRAPGASRIRRLAAYIQHVARLVPLPGKAKSRNVGWGSYGRRKQQDSITIAEPDAPLRLWLSEHRPDLLTVDITLTYPLAQRLRDLLTRTDVPADDLSVAVVEIVLDAMKVEHVGYSKNDVKRLALGNATTKVEPIDLPGVTIVRGDDEPTYKVEAPDVR